MSSDIFSLSHMTINEVQIVCKALTTFDNLVPTVFLNLYIKSLPLFLSLNPLLQPNPLTRI